MAAMCRVAEGSCTTHLSVPHTCESATRLSIPQTCASVPHTRDMLRNTLSPSGTSHCCEKEGRKLHPQSDLFSVKVSVSPAFACSLGIRS